LYLVYKDGYLSFLKHQSMSCNQYGAHRVLLFN